MSKNIEYEKYDNFLEILKNDEKFNPKIDQKKVLITTDSWLAQLSSKKITS